MARNIFNTIRASFAQGQTMYAFRPDVRTGRLATAVSKLAYNAGVKSSARATTAAAKLRGDSIDHILEEGRVSAQYTPEADAIYKQELRRAMPVM